MNSKDILDSELAKRKEDIPLLINTDNPNIREISHIIVYLLLTVYISYVCLNREEGGMVVSLYSLFTTFLLYGFYDKPLRKIKVYLIWVIISIFHFWLYYRCSSFWSEEIILLNSLDSLKYTIVILVYYQICRVINIKLKGYEFIVPLRGKSETRKATFLDHFFLGLFFIIWCKYILYK